MSRARVLESVLGLRPGADPETLLTGGGGGVGSVMKQYFQ